MGKRLERRRSKKCQREDEHKARKGPRLLFIFLEEVASSLRGMSSVPKETGLQGLQLQFL